MPPAVSVDRRQAVAEKKPHPCGRRLLPVDMVDILQDLLDLARMAEQIRVTEAEREGHDVAVSRHRLEQEVDRTAPQQGEDPDRRVATRPRGARRRHGSPAAPRRSAATRRRSARIAGDPPAGHSGGTTSTAIACWTGSGRL